MNTELPRKLFDETEEIIGLADGVFDLLHWGHIMHLNACKMFCDTLIVCIAEDNYAKKKGKNRPIIQEDKRLYSVKSLCCVDVAILCDGSVNIINQIKPDIYFRNEDYIRDSKLDPEIYVQRMPVYGSTTAIIKDLQGKE